MKKDWRVEITGQDGSQVRFFVYEDIWDEETGTLLTTRELYQCHRDVSEEIAQARQKKVGLAHVLLEIEKKQPSFPRMGPF